MKSKNRIWQIVNNKERLSRSVCEKIFNLTSKEGIELGWDNKTNRDFDYFYKVINSNKTSPEIKGLLMHLAYGNEGSYKWTLNKLGIDTMYGSLKIKPTYDDYLVADQKQLNPSVVRNLLKGVKDLTDDDSIYGNFLDALSTSSNSQHLRITQLQDNVIYALNDINGNLWSVFDRFKRYTQYQTTSDKYKLSRLPSEDQKSLTHIMNGTYRDLDVLNKKLKYLEHSTIQKLFESTGNKGQYEQITDLIDSFKREVNNFDLVDSIPEEEARIIYMNALEESLMKPLQNKIISMFNSIRTTNIKSISKDLRVNVSVPPYNKRVRKTRLTFKQNFKN